MGIYIVKKGDTLSGIAQSKLGSASRWPELQRLNDIPDADLIYPGQVIKLPGRGGFIGKLIELFRRS